MKIIFTRISDHHHMVKVIRRDGTSEEKELDSRSFLRHDFAHFAVETQVPLALGYWGSVAAGESISGYLAGPDIAIAESLAGPVQTLMRTGASAEKYLVMLEARKPVLASPDLAVRIHEKCRQLEGHWRATHYGGEMRVEWLLPAG